MSPSLRTLLSGLIDYAGLFPPAQLPLPEALANYLRYRGEPEAWMLGRFLCPAARLGEIGSHESLTPPLVCSALGRGGASAEEVLSGLEEDLGQIDACRQRQRGGVRIDVLEMKVPALAEPLLERIRERTADQDLTVFVEPGSITTHLPARMPFGLKLRCGGMNARAFPSSQQVAEVLEVCARAGVALKATAGLHHPLPRRDPVLGARMHGFVNLFVAGILAASQPMDPARMVALLDDEDPSHFVFAEDAMVWQDLRVSVADLARLRGSAMVSFGSCSFDEPRDDLRGLGWL